ncbi:hypothetical protein FB451DRAFT_1302199 [Mycena latifolia]|nr:hypothetical protein FB451DRAFT_1302199 [Mycena latifolia]
MLATRLGPSLRRYASGAAQKKAPPPPAYQPPPPSLKARVQAARRKVVTQSVDARAPDPSLSGQEREMEQIKAVLGQREKMKKHGLIPPPIELPLLDHTIPYAVSFKARKEYPSLRAVYDQFLKNRINDGKNAFAMRHLGVADSFPDVSIDPRMGWFSSGLLFARRVFQAQSLKSTAWVAPMRQEFLVQYVKLNEALSKDSAQVTQLTMPPFRDEVLSLARKRPAGQRYIWTFHREVTPTRILSLRAADGNFDKEMPASGSRVAVQALVRFDTEQSIEIYDRTGRALHTPAPGAATADTHTPRAGNTLQQVPAEKKRVTEYLVLDKPMYEPGAEWRFRARHVPVPGRTVAV